MNTIRLSDLDIHAVGSDIQLVGGLWQGQGKTFLTILPDESLDGTELVALPMSLPDWQTFLRQTDLLETEILVKDQAGERKAIVRKTQRQIDSNLQWECFERDSYRCKYCFRKVPLTVDHIVTWESFGATVKENLVSCCKKCNRTRGNMPYEDWIKSEDYKKLSANLPEEVKKANEELVGQLPYLRTLRVQNIRSR